MPDLPEITAVEVLRLHQGDVLVLRLPGPVGESEAAEVRARLGDCFPGVQALILSDGAELSVVRRNTREVTGE